MLSNEVGWALLIGIFALAGVLLAAKILARRAGEERLRALGFEPCDAEAPGLLEAYTRLAGGHGAGETSRFQLARCFKRPAGRGFVYRFTAADLSVPQAHDPDRSAVAPTSDVYLLDLGARASAVLQPCSVFLATIKSRFFKGLLAQMFEARPPGQKLALPADSEAPFLAAFGAASGSLDEHLGKPLLELTARAAEAGFFAAHFGAGKVALEAPDGVRAVDEHWNAVADWLAP